MSCQQADGNIAERRIFARVSTASLQAGVNPRRYGAVSGWQALQEVSRNIRGKQIFNHYLKHNHGVLTNARIGPHRKGIE
jgi:hypothetical protein